MTKFTKRFTSVTWLAFKCTFLFDMIICTYIQIIYEFSDTLRAVLLNKLRPRLRCLFSIDVSI